MSTRMALRLYTYHTLMEWEREEFIRSYRWLFSIKQDPIWPLGIRQPREK